MNRLPKGLLFVNNKAVPSQISANCQTVAFGLIELIPTPEQSSRKIAMGILLHLHEVRIGFNNLVNKYSADDNPKGKIVNRKYFTTPSPKSQEKAK